MDFIVRLFRVLANTNRLAILRFIIRHPESMVATIAEELEMKQPALSNSLKHLSEHGLVDKRPAGTYVLTRLGRPASARHPVLKRVLQLLPNLYGSADVQQVCELAGSNTSGPTWTEIHAAASFEFTAYTHLRRLLILRFLAERGSTSLDEIRAVVGMSRVAVRRHVDKLVRRNLVRGSEEGEEAIVSIRKRPTTWLRRELLGAVLSSFRGEANDRTS